MFSFLQQVVAQHKYSARVMPWYNRFTYINVFMTKIGKTIWLVWSRILFHVSFIYLFSFIYFCCPISFSALNMFKGR